MARRHIMESTFRLNLLNPQHAKINEVIKGLNPKIYKSKNQFLIEACEFYIDHYGEDDIPSKEEKRYEQFVTRDEIEQIKKEIEVNGRIQSEKERIGQYDETELAIGEMSNKGDSRSNSIYLEAVYGLNAGEISDVYYDDSIGYYAVRYLGRKEGSGLSYDEVRNRLEDMIMTEQFQRYLTDREEELSVTVVDRVYDTIKWN